MRALKKNEYIDEMDVITRIRRGIYALTEEADPHTLVDVYNKWAVCGSGQIAVVEDEGGDYELNDEGETLFIVTEDG